MPSRMSPRLTGRQLLRCSNNMRRSRSAARKRPRKCWRRSRTLRHSRRRVRAGRRDLSATVLFLLPGFLGLATFLLLPLFASLALSFTNWQVIGETRFVGLANYRNLLTRDPVFWGVVRVTLHYTAEY